VPFVAGWWPHPARTRRHAANSIYLGMVTGGTFSDPEAAICEGTPKRWDGDRPATPSCHAGPAPRQRHHGRKSGIWAMRAAVVR
jgi:hypothetical protein